MAHKEDPVRYAGLPPTGDVGGEAPRRQGRQLELGRPPLRMYASRAVFIIIIIIANIISLSLLLLLVVVLFYFYYFIILIIIMIIIIGEPTIQNRQPEGHGRSHQAGHHRTPTRIHLTRYPPPHTPVGDDRPASPYTSLFTPPPQAHVISF
jgi:hypothetical protein